jgi:hypothetical protein
MEEIRKERCTACGGTTMENILRFNRRDGLLCYVACANCGAFVARYRVERYVSRRPYESILAIITRNTTDSSRRISEQIEGYDEGIAQEFERVKRVAEQNESEAGAAPDDQEQ